MYVVPGVGLVFGGWVRGVSREGGGGVGVKVCNQGGSVAFRARSAAAEVSGSYPVAPDRGWE